MTETGSVTALGAVVLFSIGVALISMGEGAIGGACTAWAGFFVGVTVEGRAGQ